MDFSILHMSKSPFYKESHHDKYVKGKKAVKVDFKISESAYNDLMKYFRANGISKTDGLKQLVWDKLEAINTFQNRKIFNNIEFIMIFPKTDDIVELTEKAKVIALYNTECDFLDGFNHKNGFNSSFNFQYELKPFHRAFFGDEMVIINSTKDSPVRRVNKGDLQDWESLHHRLDEIYDLKNETYYFVRCPLNNYLDIKWEGQLQSKEHRGEHVGIYAFNDYTQSLFCIVNWAYSSENKNMLFDVYFVQMGEFIEKMYNSDFKPLRESIEDIQHSEYNKNQLDNLIQGQELWLEMLKKTRKKFD